MKLFLYRCLVFLLLSLALALVVCPWTDAAPQLHTTKELLAMVLNDASDTSGFIPVDEDAFPHVAASAAHIATKNMRMSSVPLSIGLGEWKRLCESIEISPRDTARLKIGNVHIIIWHGELTVTRPEPLAYFGAMRRSIGWILLFFSVLLGWRLYSPPPYLPRPLVQRIIFWDVLAVLTLSLTAFLFLQYLATAIYGLTPSTNTPTAQLIAMALYVPLLPVLSILITIPCRRADPHF